VADVDARTVKVLREKTGAGMMDCKTALRESDGDLEKAELWLREKGLSDAKKRSARAASEGQVHAYIHHDGRTGVLVEMNCETDFVARTTEFLDLIHDVALHIAAAAPDYVSREDVPEELAAKERQFLEGRAKASGKPEQVIAKIVEGQMKSFYEQHCLLDQPFVRDDKRTVGEMVSEVSAKVGENVRIRRFSCFKVGR
jgi:elongation factor Ts